MFVSCYNSTLLVGQSGKRKIDFVCIWQSYGRYFKESCIYSNYMGIRGRGGGFNTFESQAHCCELTPLSALQQLLNYFIIISQGSGPITLIFIKCSIIFLHFTVNQEISHILYFHSRNFYFYFFSFVEPTYIHTYMIGCTYIKQLEHQLTYLHQGKCQRSTF